ncbi:MAG: hypothetical protein AAGI92_02485 [Pseudomonadota bacterium]
MKMRDIAAPAAIASVILMVGTFGVAAYASEGTQMFVKLVETGLAWCF